MKTNKTDRLKLEDIPKRNIHSVPDGYFNSLEQSILAKVKSGEPKSTPAFTIGLNWQTAAIAAAVTLLVVFVGTFNSINKPADAEDILAQVSIEDIIEYLDYSDLTTSEIVAALNINENDADDFLENDIQLLNTIDFESLDNLDLYHEYGIDENIF